MKALKRIFSRLTIDDRLDAMIAEASTELESAQWATIQAEDNLEGARASLEFCKNRLEFLESRRVIALAIDRSRPLVASKQQESFSNS